MEYQYSKMEFLLEGGEKEVITIFFIGTTIVSSIGGLCYWVGSAALTKYMKDKGYMPPSDDEMKTCCAYVLKKLFHIR